jgi:hypothetical protein
MVLSGDDPVHPDEWDERVEQLVRFVERERGLTFDHPVYVDFLDEQAWEAQGDIDEEEILDENAQFLEHGAGMFRAVGLAEGDLDLLADFEQLGTIGTVGLYLFDDERIMVRGESLTPRVKATLVHELTHALQDQHYDIGHRMDRIREGETAEDSLRVLAEGDADRIEYAWTESLPDVERAALEDEESDEGEAAFEGLEALPDSLIAFFASDYILGAGFITVLEAEGGDSAVDDAFRSPPGPDEHVLDPLAYLDGDQPEDADPPDVEGEPIEDLDGDFGAVSWFLMLAERTDPVAALAAVDGWGGDAFRGYTDGDRTCVALRFIGEDADAARRMEAAVAQWVAAMPAEADAEVERDADVVDLVTCDPGADADVVAGDGRSQGAITLPAIRAVLVSQVLDGGGTTDQARCFARGVITNLDYEIMTTAEPTAEQEEQIQATALEQAVACM